MNKYQLAPLSEQDKLDEGLLRTSKGGYLSVPTSNFTIDRKDRIDASNIEEQDKLEEGLIRFNNGSYHSIDSVEEVTEGCFIATAVYGDINAPEVRALRGFRDDVLRQSFTGRLLVELYYSGFGKKAGNLLKERFPSAIPLVRKGLDYIAKK